MQFGVLLNNRKIDVKNNLPNNILLNNQTILKIHENSKPQLSIKSTISQYAINRNMHSNNNTNHKEKSNCPSYYITL